MPKVSVEQAYWQRTMRCPRCQRVALVTRTYKSNGEILRGINPKDPTGLAECPHCHGRWFNFEQPSPRRVVEEGRSYEPAKVDTMVLDNRRGTSPLVRRVTIDEEWSQQYDLETEVMTKDGLQLGGEKTLGVAFTAEQTLKERYAISERTSRHYVDEFTFDVPSGVLRTITFTYKHAVQHGRLVVDGADGVSVEIPYRVVVDLLLDVAQDDGPDGHV